MNAIKERPSCMQMTATLLPKLLRKRYPPPAMLCLVETMSRIVEELVPLPLGRHALHKDDHTPPYTVPIMQRHTFLLSRLSQPIVSPLLTSWLD